MKTIKRKDVEAWADEAEVDIWRKSNRKPVRGYIERFDTNWSGSIHLRGEFFDGLIDLTDLADVRFVGEEAGEEMGCGCFHHSGTPGYLCEHRDCPLNTSEPPASDTASEPEEISRKFTSGQQGDVWYVYDRNRCVGLGAYHCVAQIDRDVPVELREEYADLFAAAPELADALRKVSEIVGSENNDGDLMIALGEDLKYLIRAALAKAEGKKPGE